MYVPLVLEARLNVWPVKNSLSLSVYKTPTCVSKWLCSLPGLGLPEHAGNGMVDGCPLGLGLKVEDKPTEYFMYVYICK